jgi:WD40 repeat protein
MSDSLLDDGLPIPKEASLAASASASLETSSGAAIAVSAATCQRSQGRCLIVGRQAAVCDIRIEHGSISRKHAVLYYIEDKLYVQDLGGKHGTHVNGTRLQEDNSLMVKDGDSIIFGNVRESVFTVKLSVSTSSEVQPENLVADADADADEALTVAQHVKDQDVLEQAGEGLSGRAKRQAEIAAMMASLDQAPEYEKFTATNDDHTNENADTKADAPSQPSEMDQVLQIASKHKLPVTQILVIQSESTRRSVSTCLAIDPAGSRFVVGSIDMNLRFYDFGGMDRQKSGPFKTVIPDDGHVLVSLSYSNTGDRVLVGTGSVQPKVLNREGDQVIQFLRGDMYVADQTRTTGHTAAVTAVDWHPLERDLVLTASRDGSVRLWNLNGKTQFEMLVCDKVFSIKNARGQRTAVTAVCFHPGGREFAVGSECGSIQVWSRARVSGRPERAVYEAHGVGKPIHSLTYNVDGSKLASRSSEDDTCKIWNSRRLSRSSLPIQTCTGLPSVHEASNAAFSPDGRLLCAGSSEYREVQGRRNETGSLKLYAVQSNDSSGADTSVEPLLSLEVEGDTGPVVVKWHAKLNQIFVGCSDGRTIIYYDPKLSSKGALLLRGKVGRGVDDLSALLNARAPKGSAAVMGEIITPFAPPREDAGTKRKRDDRKELEPERPISGKHKTGGTMGGNLNFQQFIADQTVSKTKVIAGKDPREALFEYSEGKNYISQAYKGNKETILHDKTAEEEDEEMRSKK